MHVPWSLPLALFQPVAMQVDAVLRAARNYPGGHAPSQSAQRCPQVSAGCQHLLHHRHRTPLSAGAVHA